MTMKVILNNIASFLAEEVTNKYPFDWTNYITNKSPSIKQARQYKLFRLDLATPLYVSLFLI